MCIIGKEEEEDVA